MTNAALVPVVDAAEKDFVTSPNGVSVVSTAPAAYDAALACVILSAASTPPPSDIARRIAGMLAPLAVDITAFSEAEALPYLHSGHAVFLISSTDWLCLELARERAGWLRLHGLEDRCGLVLWHVPGGATAEQAEDYTGVPVCALLDQDEHLVRFANWISAEHRRLTRS